MAEKNVLLITSDQQRGDCFGSGDATPVAVLGSASLDVNDIDVNTLTDFRRGSDLCG